MTSEKPKACGAVKHGRVDLACELPESHLDDPDSWHESTFTEQQEITYPGARHSVTMTERVTWAQVDHAAEAVRALMRDRRRS